MTDIICHMCGQLDVEAPEHHFPKWMRKYLPIAKTSSFNFATGVIGNKDVGVRTVPGICRTCNNGWMAQLQERAKPALVPVLRDSKPQQISPTHAALLAQWFTMFTMVFENDHPAHKIGIPQVQRKSFSECQVVPADWKIWIGATNDRRAGGRGVSHLPVAPFHGATAGQITVAQFGQAILAAASGVAPTTGVKDMKNWGMCQIFPSPSGETLQARVRFPRHFHPRVLADVLNGTFPTPMLAQNFPMGTLPHYKPPPDYW